MTTARQLKIIFRISIFLIHIWFGWHFGFRYFLLLSFLSTLHAAANYFELAEKVGFVAANNLFKGN